MEVLIDCYFDRLFEEMDRSCLASRYKRREMVDYFSDVINSCSEGNGLDIIKCRVVTKPSGYYSLLSGNDRDELETRGTVLKRKAISSDDLPFERLTGI